MSVDSTLLHRGISIECSDPPGRPLVPLSPPFLIVCQPHRLLSLLLGGRFGQSQSSLQLSTVTFGVLTPEDLGRGNGIRNGSLHTLDHLSLGLDSVLCFLLSVSRLLLGFLNRISRLVCRFEELRANLEGKRLQ